jgi:hypothetical protein
MFCSFGNSDHLLRGNATERFEPKTFLFLLFLFTNLQVLTYTLSISDFNKLNLACWVGCKLWLNFQDDQATSK